eukprot:gene54562-72914_t
MLHKLGTGLFVTELMGQGVNYVTGDYSRGASGFWVEGGRIAFPVQEITIAGNMRTMFKGISAVGADVYESRAASLLRPELLALAAALCWAVGSLFSARAASRMGTIGFNRWRLVFACSVLWVAVGIGGHWTPLAWSDTVLLSLSGLVGICIGDTALFACMNRLGPRRSGVLFASHALFSALLAWWLLGETLWGAALVGSIFLVAGVMVAVLWGRRDTEQHIWEETRGRLLVGVALGLTAALCQAVATLMVKPLMAAGVDAVAGSAVRL